MSPRLTVIRHLHRAHTAAAVRPFQRRRRNSVACPPHPTVQHLVFLPLPCINITRHIRRHQRGAVILQHPADRPTIPRLPTTRRCGAACTTARVDRRAGRSPIGIPLYLWLDMVRALHEVTPLRPELAAQEAEPGFMTTTQTYKAWCQPRKPGSNPSRQKLYSVRMRCACSLGPGVWTICPASWRPS